ncbi:hypothetical protein [Aliarcobacter thereius]|uniref:Uncharacterized protein n=2 Tax=Aliarcobacter thereius TaxID=544718 RepID=A0A1C0B8R2_9BACT|nr:hypothetical protein [Aliarcobacter thereius]OCL93700.1 hypothetical protein AAX25_00019 [Aliarcobacter thereius]OCL95106.1 hypothetical protein AA347_00557 [Aliarcobacter thereius LMG 24486]OCL99994.1 hypothetical protein AAX29_01047 [Aliarcobacter thereius]QBF16904.1 putative membrane protein [Aliarcobacter thereius LMG 24486]TLS94068.1 hypothetical protein FE244_02015 [Aliarcobacter thereius]
MYKEISKELKASLFQRIKSPFFSSFLIGILIFNYRYILVLLSTKSIEDKFNFIDTYKPTLIFELPYIDLFYQTTLIYPFFFAFVWIGIIPFFERYISMPIWKWHQNKLKEKFAKLEKEEIFLGSERDKYLSSISNIRKKTKKLEEELTNIDLATQTKIEKAIKNEQEKFEQEKERLNADIEIRLKAKEDEIKKQKDEEIINVKKLLKESEELNNKTKNNLEKLQTDNQNFRQDLIQKYEKGISEKDDEVNAIRKTNEELKNKLTNYENEFKKLEEFEKREKETNRMFELQKKDILKDFTIDEIKFLEIIYKNNIQDNHLYSNFIDEIQKYYSNKRMDLEKILEDLIEKKFITSNGGYIYYAKDIKDLIYKAFKNNY